MRPLADDHGHWDERALAVELTAAWVRMNPEARRLPAQSELLAFIAAMGQIRYWATARAPSGRLGYRDTVGFRRAQKEILDILDGKAAGAEQGDAP